MIDEQELKLWKHQVKINNYNTFGIAFIGILIIVLYILLINKGVL